MSEKLEIAKQLIKDAIDKSNNTFEIMQNILDGVYKQGYKDGRYAQKQCNDCMYYAPNINANSTCLNGESVMYGEDCKCFELRKDKR